ncbi:MAG: DUF2357 domain-containing protein [Roseiflexus sp.]
MISSGAIALLPEMPGDLPALSEHQAIEFVYLPENGQTPELAVDGVVLMPFLRPGDPRWHWMWHSGADVGIHTLRLVACGETRVERVWRLRVLPRKIDAERFLALIEDIEQVAIGLVRSLAGAVIDAHLVAGEGTPRSWLDDADILFGSLFDQFEQAAHHILKHPRSTLQRDERQIPLGQAADVSVKAVQRALQGDLESAPPGTATDLQRMFHPRGGFLPGTITQERSSLTCDTAEHRLLKYTLEALRGRAQWCSRRAEHEVARLSVVAPGSPRTARARAIASHCRQCAGRIAALLAAPLFDRVTTIRHTPVVTPLIRRDPSYRCVYRMWRAMSQRMTVDPGAPFDLTIIDLPLLYERWCVLRVVQSLLDLDVNVSTCNILTVPSDDTGVRTIDLCSNAPMLVAAYRGWTLTLRYQPHYRPAAKAHSDETFVALDRHTRIPDIAIEARRPDHPPRMIVLDAKYRLDANGQGVPADALAEAYAYTGAIGVAGIPAVAAALILYSGSGNAERYPGGAGAVPLLPGAADALEATLASELQV